MINNQIYIILCRKVTKNIYVKYTNVDLNNIIFISDTQPDINHPNIIYYEDNIVKNYGFRGMHSKIEVSSWDKAFYYLKDVLSKSKYY